MTNNTNDLPALPTFDYAAALSTSRAATAALARIHELITRSDESRAARDAITEPPYYSDEIDLANEMMRDLLITDDDYHPLSLDFDYYTDDELARSYRLPADFDIRALAAELAACLDAARASHYHIHDLSLMRLEYSLCPMHHCDYAACFDDDDPECANIRALFPSHDT
jgi:hypothetical protein